MNEREIVNIVRDALRFYYEQRGAAPATLIAELEQEAAAGLRTIQQLVDDMARQRRIWLSNDMITQLADPKADIGGSYSRERWIEIQVLFDAFGKWLETPHDVAEGVAVAPLVIISRRSNPAWSLADAAEPTTEEEIPVEQA